MNNDAKSMISRVRLAWAVLVACVSVLGLSLPYVFSYLGHYVSPNEFPFLKLSIWIIPMITGLAAVHFGGLPRKSATQVSLLSLVVSFILEILADYRLF